MAHFLKNEQRGKALELAYSKSYLPRGSLRLDTICYKNTMGHCESLETFHIFGNANLAADEGSG